MTWPEYLAAKYTASTATAYAFEVDHYLSWVGGEAGALEADYSRIVGYLAGLRDRYDKPATLRRIVSAVKAYHRYLLESSQRSDHPAAGLRLRDGRRRGGVQVPGSVDGRRVGGGCWSHGRSGYEILAGRNAVIIGLLVHQALTVREVSLLKVGDIDLVAGRVDVAATWRTTGRKLALATAQVMQLHTYLTEQRPQLLKLETDRLVLTSRGTEESGEGIHYLVETLRPVVKGKRLTPTVIRQSVIALRLKKGEGLRQVQTFAGHKWVSTTEGYRENNLRELKAAVARCHPLGEDEKLGD